MTSSSISMPDRRRTYVRMLGEIRHALLTALSEEAAGRGLTKAGMARELGCDKSFVTRKLEGTSNMTLETLADLAFALNRPVKVSLPARTGSLGSNSTAVPAADVPLDMAAWIGATGISLMSVAT